MRMALPTMQPYYKQKRCAVPDHNYYVKVANDTAKQRQWNSSRCMERSQDAYRDHYVADRKQEKLALRRKQLAELLSQENMMYQAELRTKRSHPGMVSDIKSKVEYLREQKEIQRKKIAEEKLKLHMRENAPELRNIHSAQLQEEVHKGWETQRSARGEEREAAQKQKLEDLMESERAAIRYELEKQQTQEHRKQEAVQQSRELREQMEKLQLREQESSLLQAQEEEVILQQDELARAEKERADMDEKRERIQFGRLLKAQALAALRRRSHQIQEELELDLKILKSLSAKEVEQAEVQTSRREKAKADAAWMKGVVEEQLQLERAREAELDTMYREEAARQWEKRETQWQREAEARQRLMKDVLDGRVQQLTRRQVQIRQDQEESIRAREVLLRDMEVLAQETARETARTEREKEERRKEIDRQTTERRLADHRTARDELDKEEGERRKQDEYAAMIRNEAQAMTARGYMSRGRRGAWQ